MMLWMMGAILSANADVVGEGPADCPRGATPTANHNGPYCTPNTCTGTCPDGQRCASLGLCVLEEERPCGGMVDPNEPCTYTHTEATDSCETDADCSRGTCIIADRCAEPRTGCGCASTSGAPLAVVGLSLLTLAAWRHRRR